MGGQWDRRLFGTAPSSKAKMSRLVVGPTADIEGTMGGHHEHPFAFNILWSPIPVITWLFPFIGA